MLIPKLYLGKKRLMIRIKTIFSRRIHSWLKTMLNVLCINCVVVLCNISWLDLFFISFYCSVALVTLIGR